MDSIDLRPMLGIGTPFHLHLGIYKYQIMEYFKNLLYLIDKYV